MGVLIISYNTDFPVLSTSLFGDCIFFNQAGCLAYDKAQNILSWNCLGQ